MPNPIAFLAAVTVLGSAPQQVSPTWQQEVAYRIEASLDEGTDVLSGRARVEYLNRSPDTLTAIYFHLYLNAFRPNSAWSRSDLEHGIRTFQDLGPDDHGYERLTGIRVDGMGTSVSYPHAPDSTIVKVELPAALPPGGRVTVEYDWNARLSTVPRRQGRAGRHYDFAQWYPRVVVYDLKGWRDHPLYRQGEFYGEFATYDVTLEVTSDQVMGATGVHVEGDPGWTGAAVRGSGPIDLQRDWYGSTESPPCVESDGRRTCGVPSPRDLAPATPLGLLDSPPNAGRKRVRWYAENVHHFAWSVDPEYIYEQGAWEDVAIRVLYRPGDEESWGSGVAVRRTIVALQWLDALFGDYPYPQVTNVHRLEGGGTEFPMMVMDGSASQALILHEVGHIYTHGILANNEWYEGWLDEGFSSFQTAWFFEQVSGERQWAGSEMRILDLELRGKTEPVTLEAERYSEMGIYGAMVYTKGSLVFWMLREMVGPGTMQEILRTFYDRYRFRHVDQRAFQSVAEEVTGRDLDWFFEQWLHRTGVVDYALGDVRRRSDGAGWVTEVDVRRNGEMVMPVPIVVEGGARMDQALDTVVPGEALRGTHVLRTAFRPEQIRLDPRRTILDWNATNDRWSPGLFGRSTFNLGLDDPLSALPLYRDQAPLRLFPLVWLNHGGGLNVGLQARSAYLGDIQRVLLRVGLPAMQLGEKGDQSTAFDPGSLYFRLDNPIVFGRPRYGASVETFAGEGRVYLGLGLERDVSRLPLAEPRLAVRAWMGASALYDKGYPAPGRWDPDLHQVVEVGFGASRSRAVGWSFDVEGSAGLASGGTSFFRGSVTAELEERLGPTGATVGIRGYAGGVMAHDSRGWRGEHAPRERQVFLAGADPYRALSNPFIRSSGAALDELGRIPGGGDLVGYHPGLSFAQLATVRGEVRTAQVPADLAGRSIRARALAFAGMGVGSAPWGDGAPPELTPQVRAGLAAWSHLYASVGAGVEVGFADSPVRVRLDVPFFVADPVLATRGRNNRLGARVAVSVAGYR